MKWRNLSVKYSDRITELGEQLNRDPYAILGIEETATDEEVKRAYREQAKSYHPDKQGDFVRAHSLEVMKIVNEAYAHICAKRNQ